MSELIVIENTDIEIIEVAPRMEVTPEFNNYLGQVNASAASASASASVATTQAGIATTKASEAAASASAASTQAGIATTKASEASASADTALIKASEAAASADSILGAVDESAASALQAEGYKNAASEHALSAANSASNAAGYATNSQQYAVNASNYTSSAQTQADRAASFVGGNWPLPHSHVTGPRIVDPEFSRASAAYDSALRRWEYNERRWGENGTLIEEGTTNLLPTGAENFVTGWTNGTGETCTVTDYPIYIDGVGDVIAKRITGNGLGSNIYKRYTTYTTGIANPHTSTVSCWCMSLNPAKNFYISDTIGSSTIRTLIPTTMTRISSTQNVSSDLTSFGFLAPTITDIIDIVVYAPQIELKTYATTYTAPGTTRVAATLALPIGAVDLGGGNVDYSNALIDPAQPFTFRAKVYLGETYLGTARVIFEATTAMETDRVVFYLDGTNLKFLTIKSGSRTRTAAVGSLTGSHSFGFTFNPTTNTPELWLDGVKLTATLSGTGSTPAAFTTVGLGYRSYNKTGHLNGCLSNLEIAKIKRTDTEMAYTGKLLPDEYTTFYSDMKESISSRPFVRKNGQAQNVVLAGDSPNQNAIINGDFRLASRGTSFSNPATSSKVLDGFELSYNGSGATVNITQESFTAGQQTVVGATKFMRYAQTVAPIGQTINSLFNRIEDVNMFSGQQVRLQFWGKASAAFTLPLIYFNQNFGTSGSASVASYFGEKVLVGTSWRKYSFVVRVPSVAGKTINAGNHINVFFNLPLNSAFTLDLADIELKPADCPDSYYRRDLQMLQQLRNRYLQSLPANLQLRAVNVQTNYIDFESVVLPTEMRATPALAATYAETTNWKVLSTAGVQTTGFALALLNASANQVAFRATKTAHGLTNATLQLVTNVLLSAEL